MYKGTKNASKLKAYLFTGRFVKASDVSLRSSFEVRLCIVTCDHNQVAHAVQDPCARLLYLLLSVCF